MNNNTANLHNGGDNKMMIRDEQSYEWRRNKHLKAPFKKSMAVPQNETQNVSHISNSLTILN
jgi:hypothetical protein